MNIECLHIVDVQFREFEDKQRYIFFWIVHEHYKTPYYLALERKDEDGTILPAMIEHADQPSDISWCLCDYHLKNPYTSNWACPEYNLYVEEFLAYFRNHRQTRMHLLY